MVASQQDETTNSKDDKSKENKENKTAQDKNAHTHWRDKPRWKTRQDKARRVKQDKAGQDKHNNEETSRQHSCPNLKTSTSARWISQRPMLPAHDTMQANSHCPEGGRMSRHKKVSSLSPSCKTIQNDDGACCFVLWLCWPPWNLFAHDFSFLPDVVETMQQRHCSQNHLAGTQQSKPNDKDMTIKTAWQRLSRQSHTAETHQLKPHGRDTA